MNLSFTLWVVTTFAVYRLVRLAIVDTIFDVPRAALYNWLGKDRNTVVDTFTYWLLMLVTCQWCLGVWVAGAATAGLASDVDASLPVWLLIWMSVAAGQSILHVLEETSEHVLGLDDPVLSDVVSMLVMIAVVLGGAMVVPWLAS